MTAKKVIEKEKLDMNDIDSKQSKTGRESGANIVIAFANSLVELSDSLSKEAMSVLEPVIGQIPPFESTDKTRTPSVFPPLFFDLCIKFEIIENNLKNIQKIINATELDY